MVLYQKDILCCRVEIHEKEVCEALHYKVITNTKNNIIKTVYKPQKDQLQPTMPLSWILLPGTEVNDNIILSHEYKS